jgi:hypothetical protein
MNVFIPYQGPVNDQRFSKSLLLEFSENNVTRKLQVEIETQYISQEMFPPPRLEKIINWVIGRGPVLTEDRSSKTRTCCRPANTASNRANKIDQEAFAEQPLLRL